MMLLRLLNPQGIAGLAATLALAILLLIQKGETRLWHKQSGQFEQLYAQQQSALAVTVANYRAAADAARTADSVNSARVEGQQRAINERTKDDFQTRIAAARAAAAASAGRLRADSQTAADFGAGRAAPVPGLSASAGGPDHAARENRLPPEDALTATEQAIQLDELIKWTKMQADVNANGPTAPARSLPQP